MIHDMMSRETEARLLHAEADGKTLILTDTDGDRLVIRIEDIDAARSLVRACKWVECEVDEHDYREQHSIKV